MIEGAAETLLLSPSTLGSHKNEFNLWGKDTFRARGSIDRHSHTACILKDSS